MKLVMAKCPNCGGILEVNREQDAAVCKFCGTPFIVERAIQNYNITNNYTTVNKTVINAQNVNVVNGDFVNLKKLGFDAWQGRNFAAAYKYFSKALELQVHDVECILYKALAFAWMAKFEDNNLMFTNSTFQSQMLDRDFKDKNNLIRYLTELNRVLGFMANRAMSQYDGDNYGVSVVMINKNMELCSSAYVTLFSIYEKYGLKESQQQEYLKALKKYAQCLSYFLKQQKNKLSHSREIIDYKSIGVQSADRLKKVFKETENKIKSLDPQYKGAEGKRKGCYIATCVYGSYDCPEVWTLRRYRDDTLDATWFGRLFIKTYYKISPKLVAKYGDKKWFQKYWKKRLDKKVARLKKKGVADTQYEDKY